MCERKPPQMPDPSEDQSTSRVAAQDGEEPYDSESADEEWDDSEDEDWEDEDEEEQLYAFQLGNTNSDCIGAVIRVYARSAEEALQRAREAADLFLDGWALDDCDDEDCSWLDSVRVYMDGSNLKVTDGDLD